MSSDEVKWGHVELMKLLDLLREQPVLWNKNLPEYGNVNPRKLALEYIATEMNTTSDKIRRKLHTMRSQYTKECRMMRTNPNYKPRWKLFNNFKFVFQHQKHNSSDINDDDGDDDTQSSMNESNFEGKHNSYASEQDSSESFHENDDENNSEEPEQSYSIKNEPHNVDSPCHIQRSATFSNGIKTMSEAPYLRDEFTIFGENVANELRLLSNYRSIQLALKCKILKALTEANEDLQRRIDCI